MRRLSQPQFQRTADSRRNFPSFWGFGASGFSRLQCSDTVEHGDNYTCICLFCKICDVPTVPESDSQLPGTGALFAEQRGWQRRHRCERQGTHGEFGFLRLPPPVVCKGRVVITTILLHNERPHGKMLKTDAFGDWARTKLVMPRVELGAKSTVAHPGTACSPQAHSTSFTAKATLAGLADLG